MRLYRCETWRLRGMGERDTWRIVKASETRSIDHFSLVSYMLYLYAISMYTCFIRVLKVPLTYHYTFNYIDINDDIIDILVSFACVMKANIHRSPLDHTRRNQNDVFGIRYNDNYNIME